MNPIQHLIKNLFKGPKKEIKDSNTEPEQILSVNDTSTKSHYDLDNIKSLLTNGFSVKELNKLIDQLPSCRSFFANLTDDQKRYNSKATIVQLLIQIVERNGEFNILLTLVKNSKPSAYIEYEPYLIGSAIHEQADITTSNTIPLETADETDNGEENHRNDLFDKLREQGAEQSRKKNIRRQIRNEFLLLLQKGEKFEEYEIIDFYIKYFDEIDLMKVALSEFRNSENRAAQLIWILILEGVSKEKTTVFLERRLIIEKKIRTEKSLPEIIPVPVEPTIDGPSINKITLDYVKQIVNNYLEKEDRNFSIEIGALPITRIGTYDLLINFPEGINNSRKLELLIMQEDMPQDCKDGLKDVTPLTILDSVDPMDAMRTYLGESFSSDILLYYPRLSSVLVTAYQLGYWKTAWIQDVLQDWRFERDDYLFGLENRKLEGKGFSKSATKTTSSLTNVSLEENAPSQNLINSLDRVFSLNPSGGPLLISDTTRSLFLSSKLVKRDVEECKIKNILIGIVPSNYKGILNELKNYEIKSEEEVCERFLKLARIYAEQGRETLLKYSLLVYCLFKGRTLYKEKRRDSRSYLLVFLFLHNQLPPDQRQKNIGEEIFNVLNLYLQSYAINIKIESANITSEFYTHLFKAFSRASGKNILETIGRCVIEIATANPHFMSDLINRMKTAREDNTYAVKALRTLSSALQEARVFKMDPLVCMQLLNRIDTKELTIALSRQNLFQSQSSVESRRQIAIALIRLTNGSNVSPKTLLTSFAQQVSVDKRTNLAFFILVEPFFLNTPKESILKADLIAEILGFPNGTKYSEFFEGRIKELTEIINKFSRSNDPNVKGQFGYSILETIRITRKWLAEELRGELKDTMIQFFKQVESYVTAEQSKLIHDTTLELSLASDRAVFSSTQTRITLEIRNVGEGMADGLELHILPREKQYQVEKRNQTINLPEILADKTPFQKEIFIQPLIQANQSLELRCELHYNTLKKKQKKAELPSKNRTVWLYPETQFVRIAQPYSISEPATTWFYGRQDLLQSIADNLHKDLIHDTSVIVYGLKRAGKTSVVKRLIDHTLNERGLKGLYISIYADFIKDPRAKAIKTDGDFLYYLIQIINKAIPEILLDIKQYQEDFLQNPFMIFSDLINNILNSVYPKRILLVLDEFSDLHSRLDTGNNTGEISSDMFGFLSNVIQNTNQLTFIFTGTYILFSMMRENAFDLAKICTPRLVTFLDEEAARRLVIEPTSKNENYQEKGWLEYDPRVVDRIVSLTGRHPYLIQYMCMLLVDRMNRLKQNSITLNDINSIITDIVTQPANEMVMLSLWKEFGTPQHKVLSAIAAKSSGAEGWVEGDEIFETFRNMNELSSKDDILRICSSLADAELLEKSISGDIVLYRTTIPIYQMWLKQNKPVASVFNE